MPRTVDSFEYKLMLRKERFAVGENDLVSVAAEFRDALTAAVGDVVPVGGGPFEASKRRIVTFFDTEDAYLRSNSYVFRERHKVGKTKRKLTLKFRHPDRCLAQSRDMTGTDLDDDDAPVTEDLKFEEDLKPVFRKLYSFSNKVRDKSSKKLNRLDDVSDFFQDVAKRLDDWDPERAIGPVSDFSAHEVVMVGPTFALPPDITSTCALVIWYCEGQADRDAIVGEFSFKFDNVVDPSNGANGYDGPTTDKAAQLFLAVQSGLVASGWAEANLGEAVTKTRFVYEFARGICDDG